MKESLKHFFPLILTILCTLFGITILFKGFHTYGVFFDIGSPFSRLEQNHPSTTIANQLDSLENDAIPSLVYIGNALTIGNANSLSDLFVLKTVTGELSSFQNLSNAALYLVDIKSAKGFSILTRLSSAEINELEELPSVAIYDRDKSLLYFHQSGIYTLYLRLYYNQQPGVLFECRIPVETR